MKNSTHYVLTVLIMMLLNGTLIGQIIFEDDFELGSLKSEWIATPNLIGNDGIIEVRDRGGVGNSKAVILGKSADTDGFTVNVLDLQLDLSSYQNVAMSFSIADFYDGNDDIDGIYFSDDGGANFEQVVNFQTEQWCNNELSKHPTLDVDKLAATAQLSLTNQFVIRFQQRGEDDFSGSNETAADGLLLDEIEVYDPALNYRKLPVNDNFETGRLESYWSWNFADATASVVSTAPINSPINIVEVQDGAGVSNSAGVLLGRVCDGEFSVNALDLHLDLANESNVKMSFWIADAYDSSDADDGIYFSDNGGRTFKKVVDFFPQEWCNNTFSKYPQLDIDRLATAAGLRLTNQFVIRFQQRGEDDFRGSNETSADGFYIDNVEVYNSGLVYQSLPFKEDFETGLLGSWWEWNFADSTSKVPSNFAITSPISIVDVSNESIFNGTYGAIMGRICDDFFTVNALDLHLNLVNETNVEMSFFIADSYDNTDEDDGIYFSDDGGDSFVKVLSFYPEEWCDRRLSKHPPLDVDLLATKNGLSLTSQFVVRFQQRGQDDFRGSNENASDGFYIDDVEVYDPNLTYAAVPFQDDFETGLLKEAWAWNFADATATVPSNFNITSPMSIVEIQAGEGRLNSNGVVFGRECDGASTVNAFDLHLNLQNAGNTELKFWAADDYDDTDADDGIYFSADAGNNFTKVFSFDFTSTPNNRFEEYSLSVTDLANTNGLDFTNTFVIRFQQRGEDDFSGSNETASDGFYLDDVEICVNNNCNPAPPAAIDLTLTNTPETCERTDGTVTTQATNGTAPYTFLWSDGSTTATVNNLSAGTYSVTVTDASGEMANGSTTIIDDCTNTPEICNNGIDDDGDGRIDCDDDDCVEDFSCTDFCSNLTAMATVQVADCEQNNGAITLTVSGGGNYRFTWSNGATTQNITNLSPGTYTVGIFDNSPECSTSVTAFVGDDCGGNAECNITEGSLTFPDSPYETAGAGQLQDVVGVFTPGNIPAGYEVRFIVKFSNRPFLDVRGTPVYRLSGAPGVETINYLIGQFTDSTDPNYIDIDNTDFEKLADLRTAIEGKCALLGGGQFEIIPTDDYILTATEAEGEANTPILLPVTLQGGACDTLKAIQGRFIFGNGNADVTILNYVSGKIDANTIVTNATDKQNFAWSSPTGVDLSFTENDTLFYLEVSLAGNPGDINRVYFDTIQRPLVIVRCSGQTTNENVGLGVGVVRIIDNIDIEGKVVFWKDKSGISGVEMNLATINPIGVYTELTDNAGNYLIPGVPTGGEGTLIPLKLNTDPLNGVTVLDALLLKQYVVGEVDAESDYQIVAMEVNNDKSVDVLDALQIEVSLVNGTDFSPRNDWYYIPESYQFPAVNAPDYFDFGLAFTIPDIRNDIEVPFIGVKTGDVDGSATPNNLINQAAEDRNRPKQNWQYETNYKKSEGVFEVRLAPTTDITIAALQSQLAWTATNKLSLLSVEPMALPSIRSNTNLENQVRFLWVSNTGDYTNFAAEIPMVELIFKVKEGFNPTDWHLFPAHEGLSSLVVNEHNKEQTIILNKSENQIKSAQNWTHQLLQNTPNPFTGFTSIQFSLPQKELVNIAVYDSFGKQVFVQTQAYDAGKHELRLTTENWPSGLYTCLMQTEGFNAVIKMLVIQ